MSIEDKQSDQLMKESFTSINEMNINKINTNNDDSENSSDNTMDSASDSNSETESETDSEDEKKSNDSDTFCASSGSEAQDKYSSSEQDEG